MRGGALFNGKEGRGDFSPPLIMAKKGQVDFLNKIPLF